MAANPAFDWTHPDYAAVHARRVERLMRLRSTPGAIEALKSYYADHIAEFIADWGVTADPRNALLAPPRPVLMPFVLFPKQREWVEWLLERARRREPGLTEKSRDCGISWLAMATAVSLCLLRRNITIGVGSAKEDLVDRSGDPSCLFWKARTFLKNLPPEFRGGWDETRHSAHMRIQFPETGSAIVGEAGDAIGRGGRTTIFLIDESAHLERPQLIEASLSSNTDCRIDISSVSGMDNPFAQKRHAGKISVFRFHWRDDPRKTDEWYARQAEILDPVTPAAEVDISYTGSAEGVLIPGKWVWACIDAHRKLGIEPSGMRYGGLDVADEGKDKCAFAARYGILLEHLESWSGKESDIFQSVMRALNLAEQHRIAQLFYDADGLGAGVRGDGAQINQQRREAQRPEIRDEPFQGSGAVFDPESEMIEGRPNAGMFANAKAQSWWHLRTLCRNTYRAVVERKPYDRDEIISISGHLAELLQLTMELSQPSYSLNATGKVLVNKTPPGCRSPNLADAVMIAFNPSNRNLDIWLKLGVKR